MRSLPPRSGLLVALALTAPRCTSGMVMSQENLRDAPYVKFLSPGVGACVAGNADLKVAWMLVVTGRESDAAAFRAQHGRSEVCIALGSEAPETCVGALAGQDLWLTGGLPAGCHTLVGWWRAASGRPGSATSVPFSAGPSCHAACNQTRALSFDLGAGDGTASSFEAAPGRAALGFPPNAVTGGCLADKDADTVWSRARGGEGGGCRCTEGCCEAGSPLSMCEHFAFDQWHNSVAAAAERAAPGAKLGTQAAAGRSKRLPLCSECLPEVSPPDRALLPRFAAAPLVRRYLDTVKATVLNSAYANFDDADFDSLQALTMVGGRRIDSLDALVQDVLYRGVPGDLIECGCWRGGVALFAAAAFEAYAAAASTYPFAAAASGASDGASSSSSSPGEALEGGGLGGGLRRVWLADSFQGLPPVDAAQFPADAAHAGSDAISVLKANSVELVERAAAALGLTHRTRFLPGFFNESLPAALLEGTLPLAEGTLALLRLDGDLYQSTLESLHYLYPLLSVGGHVVVDDFTDWVGCRDAVADYRAAHGLTEPLQVTWHAFGDDAERGELTRGVWWTKAAPGPAYAPLGPGAVSYAAGRVRLPPAAGVQRA